LAQQSRVSVGSAWAASKLLHVWPYTITVVSKIKLVDYVKKEESFLMGLSVICMMDFLILS
jgi:hypothetical protein